MKVNFPPNPSDKMLFEAKPGIVFIYNSRDGSWTRLQGYGKQFELATPLRDGLMTKEDFKKINALLLPPPRTTLTSKSCNFTFEDGTFGFRSSKKHLFIESELELQDTDSAGNKVTKKQLWKIHDNTYGIDFRLNLPALLADLESRGKLVYRKSVGPQGKKGPPGADGIDQLDTGPKGPDGENGKNAPFPGFLTQETGAVITSDNNRGIVDIFTQEISPTENYLVAVRANLGNAEFCPSLVKPKKVNSKWIVVTDERPAVRKNLPCNTENRACLTGPGCNTTLGPAQQVLVQNFCSTRLYYFDMAPIEAEIKARYESMLVDLKAAKEKLVLEWLKVMIDVYNEQKLALCCATENCQSKRENQDHRRYIENQRVQGAGAHVSLSVNGVGTEDGDFIETQPGASCDVVPSAGQPPDRATTGPSSDCTREMRVSCTDNSPTVAEAVVAELPSGIYDVTVSTCCCYTSDKIPQEDYERGLEDISNIKVSQQEAFKALKPYVGVMTVIYQGEKGPVTLVTPNKGNFRFKEDAQKAYKDVKFQITHFGGKVSGFFAGGTKETKNYANGGILELCFTKVGDTKGFALSRAIEGENESVTTDPCEFPIIEMDINCHINNSNITAVIADLPAGEYVAEITNCCCQNLSVDSGELLVSGITGTIVLDYESATGRRSITNPDMGSFNSLNEGLSVYLGNTLLFNHRGGDVKVWTTARSAGGEAGEIRISIKKKECVDFVPPSEATDPTQIPGDIPHFQSCAMTLEQILFYEGGWLAKACCGAYVEAGGMRWLVVKRSIGTDTSCGGGECVNSDCIARSAEFGFHPAIAFPSLDGKHFFGKPTGGAIPFFRDPELEAEIINKLADSSDVIDSVGNPAFIDSVLFPFEEDASSGQVSG